ncbi:hypothetical protein B0H17DRAFT_1032403 [Mycena rosella]|uniref:Uncharacterized protein n=1 Tax=Mycena rosella TaxID=1033263 RepID=A0AAD7M9W0_MYCRO|nr:hypothetical protein B0H17DRAFT_1032403 [Mycena rosella]
MSEVGDKAQCGQCKCLQVCNFKFAIAFERAEKRRQTQEIHQLSTSYLTLNESEAGEGA